MFIAVYEFEIKPGTESRFRQAWLAVTKAIYQHCGSFGSRLHRSEQKNLMIGYAKWPSREQWGKDHELSDALHAEARAEMRQCLVASRTAYKLEVSDDYLQDAVAMQC